MPFLHNIKTFFIFFPIFLGIDLIWLGKISKSFYDKEFQAFERTLNWPAAIFVYILIPLGILLFVLPKASGNPLLGLMWGAIFGLVVYGVYNLTNLAILANWTLKLTIVDILWGIFVNGLGGFIITHISNLLK
ncbi:DUF2177 family protein [Patescibacteria group bacterium]|nr:DUF2177 family protein [Patescibacteria group bacterium]MBU2035870.1 DUF2177 family protein [Patescibacteria group bacterium]